MGGVEPRSGGELLTPAEEQQRIAADPLRRVCGRPSSVRLADLAADAEHHAIVRQRRIVQTLLVATQRIGPAAQINQVTPVRIVARQA